MHSTGRDITSNLEVGQNVLDSCLATAFPAAKVFLFVLQQIIKNMTCIVLPLVPGHSRTLLSDGNDSLCSIFYTRHVPPANTNPSLAPTDDVVTCTTSATGLGGGVVE